MKTYIGLIAAIALVIGTDAFARNDGGENGAGCTNNCGNQGGGGGVVVPPAPPPAPPAVHNQVNSQANSQVNNQANSQANSQVNNQATQNLHSNRTDVNSSYSYSYDGSGTYDKYVAPAYAPPLTTGHCMGSASAGGSGSTFGFSLGKTYVDEGCNARMDAILLHGLGLEGEAILRLCAQPAMASALGDRCPAVSVESSEGRWWEE